MPSALLAAWTPVPDRDAALARWRERRLQVQAAGGRFWVFESAADPARALEFIEAGDAATLRLVCARTGIALRDDLLLTEVELS